MPDHLCSDCQRCPACGRSAWCEGDRILIVPCEHHGYCGDCNLEHCTPCRAEAEREMFESGDYNPRADPLRGPSSAADYERGLAEYIRESGYDPATNTHRRHA